MPPKKALNRKKGTEADVERRIIVIDHDKCKPNSGAFAHLRRHAGACGKQCIQMTKKKAFVSEEACSVCVNRCKQCPGDAISVVKLPSNLSTDTTHRYGANTFKIHGLPIPRPGHVLGLLGTNGSGKSTALSILSGRVKPNLGRIEPPQPAWSDIITYYRGSDLQNYFSGVVEDKLRVAMKPQLEAGFARRLKGKTVRELMEARDERGKLEHYANLLELNNVLERQIQDLSGGELQRFAAACTMCRDADVYMFDEVSSYLDIKQRLVITDALRSLVHGGKEEWGGREGVTNEEAGMMSAKKYVIVVEHDLAVLDYMSDYVQCLYGQSGAYGVVTSRSHVRNGINQFLAGYIPAENMRFRPHELTFKVTTTDFVVSVDDGDGDEDGDGDGGDTSKPGTGKSNKMGNLRYPDMTRTKQRKNDDGEVVSKFTLHVKSGFFRDGECIVMMGENGTGKTTFMELLAGRNKNQRGQEATIGSYNANQVAEGDPLPSLASLGVAYKPQAMNPKFRRFKGTVQDLLEQEINPALADRLFRLLVIRALGIEELSDLPVASLSGGEMQRMSIAMCLGTQALVYLIDEPSAGLDCEQRVVAAKVMKRWVVNHLRRTIFLVEHDFLMASTMADKVIVFEGRPGIEATANTPCNVAEGFNRFLKLLDVTFRKDPINLRPRINKRGSRLDKLQKANGEYYLFEVTDEVDEDDL